MEAFDVSAMLREAAAVFRRANPHARGDDFSQLAYEAYWLVVANERDPRKRFQEMVASGLIDAEGNVMP